MVYLIFGEDKGSKRSDIYRAKELYKIFNDKDKAEEYKKECEAEEKKLKFTIEEWEIN